MCRDCSRVICVAAVEELQVSRLEKSCNVVTEEELCVLLSTRELCVYRCR